MMPKLTVNARSLEQRLLRVVEEACREYGRTETGITPYIHHSWGEESFLLAIDGGPSFMVTVHLCDDTE
jgi:hypothetical protein